jgi:hypothetical protein
VIAWLLDCESSRLPLDERTAVISGLAPDLLQGVGLRRGKAIREYSFGRRLRIDLVLEMDRIDDEKTYLLIECKTDSDVSLEQLQRSEKAFSERVPNAHFAVISLAVGAAQFTIGHKSREFLRCGFRTIDLLYALEVFSNLPIAGRCNIYDGWIASLEAEQTRTNEIDKVLQLLDHPWDPRLRNEGYRPGFSVFYMYYGKLREHLENGHHQNWAIYSGSNNPVMNWQKGWIACSPKTDAIELYWEFNWDTFCLKAAIKNEEIAERWAELRPSVTKSCSTCPVKGQVTRNRRGTWVTAYKWEFDFCKQTPIAIAEKTGDILSHFHERLQTIVQQSA